MAQRPDLCHRRRRTTTPCSTMRRHATPAPETPALVAGIGSGVPGDGAHVAAEAAQFHGTSAPSAATAAGAAPHATTLLPGLRAADGDGHGLRFGAGAQPYDGRRGCRHRCGGRRGAGVRIASSIGHAPKSSLCLESKESGGQHKELAQGAAPAVDKSGNQKAY